jgi:hypothetical protein
MTEEISALTYSNRLSTATWTAASCIMVSQGSDVENAATNIYIYLAQLTKSQK